MACYQSLILLALLSFLSGVAPTSASNITSVNPTTTAVKVAANATATSTTPVNVEASAATASTAPVNVASSTATANAVIASQATTAVKVNNVASTSKDDIKPTMTAKTPNPSVSVGGEHKPATIVIVIIVLTLSNEQWKVEYANKSSNDFKSFANNSKKIMETKMFPGGMYDVAKVSVVNLEDDAGKVKVKINITFGSELSAGIVIEKRVREVAENETLNLGLTVIEVTVQGVECEKWKGKGDECEKKCCNGGGGPIDITRKCSAVSGAPSDIYKRALLEKTASKCTGYCNENDCNSGVECEKWKGKGDECEKKCCNGGGGPIDITRKCSAVSGAPSDIYKRALLEKTASKCTGYCNENDCNSGSRMAASVFLVFVAIILAIA